MAHRLDQRQLDARTRRGSCPAARRSAGCAGPGRRRPATRCCGRRRGRRSAAPAATAGHRACARPGRRRRGRAAAPSRVRRPWRSAARSPDSSRATLARRSRRSRCAGRRIVARRAAGPVGAEPDECRSDQRVPGSTASARTTRDTAAVEVAPGAVRSLLGGPFGLPRSRRVAGSRHCARAGAAGPRSSVVRPPVRARRRAVGKRQLAQFPQRTRVDRHA